MKNKALSFFAAFLIHLLIVVALCCSISKKLEMPQVTAIDIVAPGEVAKEKKVIRDFNQKQQRLKGLIYHQHSVDADSRDVAKKSEPVFHPLPKIPDDLRDEAFESEAVARFYIDAAGNVERVELIKPCANPRLNNLLLKSLRSWKFSAVSASLVQDIRVNFKVE